MVLVCFLNVISCSYREVLMLKRFEASILFNGEILIYIIDENRTFTLSSSEGKEFAYELLEKMKILHPSVIKAAEQKLRLYNKASFSALLNDKTLYNEKISRIILSCCFGESDENPDWDGEKFNFEFPRMCRDITICPWNGYSKKNKDKFNVICGAKSEFGFTSQQRKVVLYIQSGITDLGKIADLLGVTKANIWKFMTSIYRKTETTSLSELIHKISDLKV